jgi:hypothetical protein
MSTAYVLTFDKHFDTIAGCLLTYIDDVLATTYLVYEPFMIRYPNFKLSCGGLLEGTDFYNLSHLLHDVGAKTGLEELSAPSCKHKDIESIRWSDLA